MSPLFRPLSFLAKVAPFTFPGLAQFVAATPPRGTWPAAGGGAGRISRSAEPLVHDQFTVAWTAPLDAASRPDELLLGLGRVVVSGPEGRGIWEDNGTPLASLPRDVGGFLIDLDGQRLLANAARGVAVYRLDGQRESTLNAAAPSEGMTSEILQGPGALVLVTLHETPHGKARAVVETLWVRDYGNTKDQVLYGIEPLAGITREDDAVVAAAAAKEGPVLATPNGVDWRDWQLRPRGQAELAAHPVALSVDERGHAHLLTDDGGWLHLQVFADQGATIFDLTLPTDAGPFSQPPLVAPSGQITLTSSQGILALSSVGQILWRKDMVGAGGRAVPATLTGNGLLLLGGEALSAVTSEGRSITLWQPPAPLLTPPVLANEHIYVATSETVFALRPA